VVPIAARFALYSFVVYNSVTGKEEFVHIGAQRDSVTDQAYLENTAAFTTTQLTAGTQIHPRQASWIANYPKGGVS
jgi:hypothetical protein